MSMTITAQPPNLNAAYRPIAFRATSSGTLQPAIFGFQNFGMVDLIYITPKVNGIVSGSNIIITGSNGLDGTYPVQQAVDEGTYTAATINSVVNAPYGNYTGNLSVAGVIQNALFPPPVVYCDVYFNGIYYKSFTSTQATKTGDYLFDISDAAKEYLSSSISPNGGTAVAENDSSMISCYCKFRDSYTDSDGFIVPQAGIPIQATSSQAAVSGDGTLSNTFFIVNATLQHDNNPDLATHLNAYKTRNWDTATFPMSHRTGNYGMYWQDSDYFPVANTGAKVITSIRLNYRLVNTNVYLQATNTPCVAVTAPTFFLPMSVVGTAYSRSLVLAGTLPITLSSIVKPAWMTVAISGSTVSFTGTPATADVIASTPVSFIATNPCGTVTPSTTILVLSNCVGVAIIAPSVLPNAQSGSAYTYAFALSGTAPFFVNNISAPTWMTIEVNGNDIYFGGTPEAGDVVSTTNVSFTLANCAGADTANYSKAIQVIAGSTAAITPGSNTINGNYRTQVFSIYDPITVGKNYYVIVYSHPVSVPAISGDTGSTIAAKLATAINSTTEAQWNTAGTAPVHGTQGFPPQASSSGNSLTITLDAYHQFGAGVN